MWYISFAGQYGIREMLINIGQANQSDFKAQIFSNTSSIILHRYTNAVRPHLMWVMVPQYLFSIMVNMCRTKWQHRLWRRWRLSTVNCITQGLTALLYVNLTWWWRICCVVLYMTKNNKFSVLHIRWNSMMSAIYFVRTRGCESKSELRKVVWV